MNYDPTTIDEQGRCICQICQRSFKWITPSHLSKHNTTVEQYKEQFPNAALASSEARARMKYTKSSLFKPEQDEPLFLKDEEPDEQKDDSEDSISLEELDSQPCFTQIEELNIPEIRVSMDEEEEEKEEDPHIPRGKRDILRYLKMIFPNLQNNFFIDKCDKQGRLLYQIVTDMADPVEKIDFEFPNAFWHNPGWPDSLSTREFKLKEDGWRIWTFNSVSPSFEEIQKHIEEFRFED